MKRRAPVPTEQETDIGLCKPAISTASQSSEPLELREAPGFENVQRDVLGPSWAAFRIPSCRGVLNSSGR